MNLALRGFFWLPHPSPDNASRWVLFLCLMGFMFRSIFSLWEVIDTSIPSISSWDQANASLEAFRSSISLSLSSLCNFEPIFRILSTLCKLLSFSIGSPLCAYCSSLGPKWFASLGLPRMQRSIAEHLSSLSLLPPFPQWSRISWPCGK